MELLGWAVIAAFVGFIGWRIHKSRQDKTSSGTGGGGSNGGGNTNLK